jgi:hypothetical protein
MRRRTRLNPNHAPRHCSKKTKDLSSAQLLAHDHSTRFINAVDLEDVLG